MFKLGVIVSAALLVLNAAGGPVSASVDLYAGEEIYIDSLGSEVKGFHPSWEKPDVRKRILCFTMPLPENEWKAMKFSFKAKKKTNVTVALRGSVRFENGKKISSYICYDNICINGKMLRNGDFEIVDPGILNLQKKPNAYYCADPGIVKFGKQCAVASINSGINIARVRMNAGDVLSFSGWARRGGTFSRSQDISLDFRSVANMGFSDSVAMDGKGGWSDQGAEMDFAGFDVRNNCFEGIVFSLINPEENKGKAILTFDSPHAKTGLKTVDLSPAHKDKESRFLYLLHASAWTEKDKNLAKIEVFYKNGEKQEISVRSSLDLNDWQRMEDAPNGKIVYRRVIPTAGSLTLSKYPLDKKIPVKSVRITGSGKSVYMLVGASLSQRDVHMTPKANFTPGKNWRVVDFSEPEIVKGSVLDLFEPDKAPAGKFGPVVVRNGQFEFLDRPGKAVRFLSSQGNLLGQLFNCWKNKLTKEDVALAKKRATTLMEAYAKQGYNAFRDMEFSINLCHGAEKECQFRPEKLDVYDYLAAEARRNGVYILLCIGTERMGYTDCHKAWEEKVKGGMKLPLLLGDPEWKERWKSVASNLLNHVNPYTGRAWKSESSILGIELFNEQTIEIFQISKLRNYREPYRTMLLRSWQGYLRENYKNRIADLNSAWKESYRSFEDINLPATGQNCNLDWSKYVSKLFLEFQSWGIRTLREIGWKGLISNINLISSMNMAAVRAEGCDFVTFNTYFAHPMNGWKEISQASSIRSGLWHIAGLTGASLRGRPMFVTEYGFGMPNPYGHESGVTMPVYASLNGFGGLSIHAGAVIIKDRAVWGNQKKNINAFEVARSPINRVNEFMSACFFKRGDVAQSPKELAFQITKAIREENNLGKFALSRSMCRLALLLKCGLEVEESRNPRFPKVRRADAVLKPAAFSDFAVEDYFVVNVDRSGNGFSLESAVNDLRKQGILPAGNRSDVENGIYQSITGEILLNTRGNIQVSTSRSEAVSLMPGEQTDALKILSVKEVSSPASVGIFAMDGQTLLHSGRLVLTFSTEMMPQNMVLSPNRSKILNPGGTVPLVRTAVLKAELALSPKKNFKLYALKVNGSRMQEIPIRKQNGKWEINLDTAALNEPAVFYELTEQ